MPDDDPSKNPFVRWKQHVDASVSATLNSLLGIPSIVSQNFSLGSRESSDADKKSQSHTERAARVQDMLDEMHNDLRKSGYPGLGSGERRSTSEALAHIDPLQTFAWRSFLLESPYSPLNLLYLPQPAPRDAPPDVDAHDFTFMDAFEDLLEVSSGRPMADLAQRQALNRSYIHWAGRSSLPGLWFGKMCLSKQLIDAYLPLHPAIQEKDSAIDEPTHTTTEERAEDWREEALRHIREEDAARRAAFWRPGSFFDELNHVFSVLNQVLEEEKSLQEPKMDGEGQSRRNDPDTEDDLYAAVKSAYTDAEKSFGTFVKAISDGKFSSETSTSYSKSFKRLGDGADEEDTKVLKDTEEHTDELGNLHITTTIRRVNSDGEEVARETHYSVRSGAQLKQDARDVNAEASGEQQNGKGEHERSGWFWK